MISNGYLHSTLTFPFQVVNHVGHYIVKQEYVNLTDETIDALYIFPVSEGGTVHHFVAKSNDKVIYDTYRTKQPMRARYLLFR